jgi:hypothetical protein
MSQPNQLTPKTSGSGDDCTVSAIGARRGAHALLELLSVLGFAWLQRRRMR